MNYIKQLESDKQDLENKMQDIQMVLSEMYVYLNSEKYKGIDERDGSMKNYVNTSDIIDRIMPVLKYTEARPVW
mgnify:CR=1 FL=1